MKTKTEPYRPAHNGLKSQTVNLRPDVEPKEKITYCIKERFYQDLCALHVRALPNLQKIASDFSTLELGQITNKDIAEIGAGNFTDIKSRYYQKIDFNILKLELSSELIKENLRAGISETWKEFQTQTENNLTNFNGASYVSGKYYPQLSVTNFTVKDGIITFSDKNKKFLKNEYSTVYIENEIQQRFIELMESTLKNLNEMKKILNNNNIGLLFSIPGVEVGIYDENDSDIVIAAGSEYVEYILK